jgi:hypothetical protein
MASITRKPSVWFSRPVEERQAIIREFWREYFTAYPEYGSSDEMNVARATYERGGGIPESFTFQR